MPTNTPTPPPGQRKFYTGRYCQYSDNKNCSGNGVVDYSGNCTCNPGFYGTYCEFSKASHCNGRGIPNLETVNGVQRIKDCTCNAGVVGNRCQFTKWNTCNGNGEVKINRFGDPYCECDDGRGGVNCEFTNARCNNNGTIVKGEDRCICNPGFDTVDINDLIKRGMPTPIPRPTGHCNDCAAGRGPWKEGDPNSCKLTWVDNRSRITNNCYFSLGGRKNCMEDPNIKSIIDQGNKIHSLSDIKTFITGKDKYPSTEDIKNNAKRPDARYTEECSTTRSGACTCTAGYNTHRCLVSGYFEPNQTEEACNNNDRPGNYNCVWGTTA